jgi:glyoxylase-like metal-dependent hydrolase (beta-lactamase superfamily II)
MPDQPALPPGVPAIVLDRPGLRVHTFTAPEAFLGNSTHVIETANSLVVVDGQFVVPYATAFRGYVDGLGKPVERVYLSHAHVDHFFGLGAAFADLEIHAPAATIATLARDGEAMRADRARQYGPLVPPRVVVPGHEVVPGTDVIDGLKYELEIVTGAECDAQLVIGLPDHAVCVTQDLVYSGAHVYVTPDTSHWVSVLRGFIDSAFDLFLAGHGPVADKAEVQRNIDYLTVAQQIRARATDPEQYKAAILAAFPDRSTAVLLDIYVPRLYGQAEQ